MLCYHCGQSGALIETNTPGYGRHFWHQGCLDCYRGWLAPQRRHAPQRYVGEPEFDFAIEVQRP